MIFRLILENSKKKANKQKIPLSLSFGSSFLLLRLAKYQSENKITEEKMALDLIQTSMDIKDLAKLYLEGYSNNFKKKFYFFNIFFKIFMSQNNIMSNLISKV